MGASCEIYFPGQPDENKKLSQAEADFCNVLETAPEDIEKIYAIGQTFKDAGQPQEVLEHLNRLNIMVNTLEDHVKTNLLTRMLAGHHLTEQNNAQIQESKTCPHPL